MNDYVVWIWVGCLISLAIIVLIERKYNSKIIDALKGISNQEGDSVTGLEVSLTETTQGLTTRQVCLKAQGKNLRESSAGLKVMLSGLDELKQKMEGDKP